jgi:MarR family
MDRSPAGGSLVGDAEETPSSSRHWTFLTNHARVLVEIARDPNNRLRDIAAGISITERAAQAIVNDLEEAGYIARTRVGRRNHYSVDPTRPFRHPADADQRIAGLLTLFADPVARSDEPPAEAGPDASEIEDDAGA